MFAKTGQAPMFSQAERQARPSQGKASQASQAKASLNLQSSGLPDRVSLSTITTTGARSAARPPKAGGLLLLLTMIPWLDVPSFEGLGLPWLGLACLACLALPWLGLACLSAWLIIVVIVNSKKQQPARLRRVNGASRRASR